jgi:uncharacterized protein YndB with AHSA1/START domain
MSIPEADLPEPDTPKSVVTECDLPDEPERVWKALTSPKLLAQWLPEAVGSEILEAQPNRKLRYRWPARKDDTDAGGRAVESVVSFELTGTTDGGTHLRVVHRVVEEVRVIPFGVRSKAPVALAGASSVPMPLRLTWNGTRAPRSRRRVRVMSQIMLRRAA